MVLNSKFQNNSATQRGGVFYLQNDFILVRNSTFIQNSALKGGVIFYDKPCKEYIFINEYLSI